MLSFIKKNTVHLVFLFLLLTLIIIPVALSPASQNQEVHLRLAEAIPNEISPYGFTLYDNFDSTVVSQYKYLKTAWVRIATQWNEIETSPGVYNWSELDKAVQLANANNIRVDFPIWRAPKFRASLRCTEDNNTLFAPVVNSDYYPSVEDLAKFAGLVARRYNGTTEHGRIDSIEIFNEFTFYDPNNLSPSVYTACRAARYYVPYLKAGYTAIKSYSRNNPILVGMLGIWYENTLYIQQFMRDMYRMSAKNYFDYANFHYYNSQSSPSPAVSLGDYPSFHQEWSTIHSVMAANNDWAKPIWVTEFGWATQWQYHQSSDWYVSAAQQAANLLYLLNDAKESQLIAKLFYYTINTQSTRSYGDCWNDILSNCPNRPNPNAKLLAYTTYKNFIAANPTLQRCPKRLSQI